MRIGCENNTIDRKRELIIFLTLYPLYCLFVPFFSSFLFSYSSPFCLFPLYNSNKTNSNNSGSRDELLSRRATAEAAVMRRLWEATEAGPSHSLISACFATIVVCLLPLFYLSYFFFFIFLKKKRREYEFYSFYDFLVLFLADYLQLLFFLSVFFSPRFPLSSSDLRS